MLKELAIVIGIICLAIGIAYELPNAIDGFEYLYTRLTWRAAQ